VRVSKHAADGAFETALATEYILETKLFTRLLRLRADKYPGHGSGEIAPLLRLQLRGRDRGVILRLLTLHLCAKFFRRRPIRLDTERRELRDVC
jgi:hypothetical protein